MVLESRDTCIAYRCPYCGKGVKSMVGVFSLSGDLKKLNCECGLSELRIMRTNDGKLRITVPCIFCDHEHSFVISTKTFFDKDIFLYPCPYSGFDLVFIGTLEAVEKAIEESDDAIRELIKANGLDDLSVLHGDIDREIKNEYLDPHLYDIVMYVINDMIDNGKVTCCCDEGEYDVAVSDDHVKVFCKNCGASKDVATDSEISARAFIESDGLKLEKL